MRVVPDFEGEWGAGAPDPRVPASGFVGRWAGSILIQSPGLHRFHARTDGAVTLRVAGRAVLSVEGGTSRPEPIGSGTSRQTVVPGSSNSRNKNVLSAP